MWILYIRKKEYVNTTYRFLATFNLTVSTVNTSSNLLFSLFIIFFVSQIENGNNKFAKFIEYRDKAKNIIYLTILLQVTTIPSAHNEPKQAETGPNWS